MKSEQTEAIRSLLENRRAGALGTLHQGAPYVSMVPFALLPGEPEFVIHVSGLAAHTRDMLADPRVSLMVVAEESPEIPVQALARITVLGEAVQYPPGDPNHGRAKAAYLARFPQSSMMFDLPDFSLFGIRPRSVRFIGGFAQATTISAAALADILR